MESLPITDVDRKGVQDLMKRGALVVDVLTPEEYRQSHIAGAINLPLAEIDHSVNSRLKQDQPVVLYCNSYQ